MSIRLARENARSSGSHLLVADGVIPDGHAILSWEAAAAGTPGVD